MLNTASLEWAPILARLSLVRGEVATSVSVLGLRYRAKVRAVDDGLASIEQDWGAQTSSRLMSIS